MKQFIISNQNQSIQVSMHTDAIGNADQFTILDIVNLTDDGIRYGIDFKIGMTTMEILKGFCQSKNLQLDVAETDKSIVTLVPLTALSFTTATLPNGTHDVAYSQAVAIAGGISPVSVTQQAGTTLVAGLTYNATTKTVSGTPTTTGACTLVLKAVDKFGVTVSKTYSFTIA